MLRFFDTSFLIDLVDRDKGAIRKAAQADVEGGLNAISVVTAHEYLRGIFYLYSKNRALLNSKLKEAENELTRFEILPYAYEIARLAAEVDAKPTIQGVSLSFIDVVIAAMGLHHGLAVVTRDVKHFKRVPKLAVETY